MELAKQIFDLLTGVFFVLSLWALRSTVKAMLQSSKETFSLFKNLPFILTLKFGLKVILVSFPCTRGKRVNNPGAGEITVYENVYKIASEIKKYRKSDPIYLDQIIYGIQAVTWGKISMQSALISFLFKLLSFILNFFQ